MCSRTPRSFMSIFRRPERPRFPPQESQMPKIKTKSGAKKRFKVTGSGKVLYAQSGKRHGMIKRTKKQIRQLRGTNVLFKTDGDNIKKYWLPNRQASLSAPPPQPQINPQEISHGPRQAWCHRTRQAQESIQGREGLFRPS